MHEVIKQVLCIVYGVQTLVNSNEVRHGGKLEAMGYMLAGGDPLSLEALGLKLLGGVEPRLKRKSVRDVLHLGILSSWV